MLFAKIKFSRKFPNLQYSVCLIVYTYYRINNDPATKIPLSMYDPKNLSNAHFNRFGNMRALVGIKIYYFLHCQSFWKPN